MKHPATYLKTPFKFFKQRKPAMNYQKYVKKEIAKYPFLTQEERKELLSTNWAGLHSYFQLCYHGKQGVFSRADMLDQIKEEIFEYIIYSVPESWEIYEPN
jgi:hypothetical protein